MSVKLMGQVWDLDLEQRRKMLLLKAADFANDRGDNIFAANSTFARKCGMSKRQVQRDFARFEADGVLLVVGNEDGGRQRPKLRQLRIDVACRLYGTIDDERVTGSHPLEPERVTDSHPLEPERVTDSHPLEPERVTAETEKGDRAVTRTVKLTKKENIHSLDADFEQWWSAGTHPLGDPREPAWQEFDRIVTQERVDPEQLIRAYQAYSADQARNEWRTPVQAVRWLKEKRWQGFTVSAPAAASTAPSAPTAEVPVNIAPDVPVSAAEAWRAAMLRLAREIGADRFRSWPGQLVLCAADGEGRFRAEAPSRFVRDWIERDYGRRLRELLGARDAAALALIRLDVASRPPVAREVVTDT